MSDDQSEKSNQSLADDLLRGAAQIGKFLGVEPGDVYYLHKAKKWPIAKHGKELIASKSKLTRHAHKITSAG